VPLGLRGKMQAYYVRGSKFGPGRWQDFVLVTRSHWQTLVFHSSSVAASAVRDVKKGTEYRD